MRKKTLVHMRYAVQYVMFELCAQEHGAVSECKHLAPMVPELGAHAHGAV